MNLRDTTTKILGFLWRKAPLKLSYLLAPFIKVMFSRQIAINRLSNNLRKTLQAATSGDFKQLCAMFVVDFNRSSHIEIMHADACMIQLTPDIATTIRAR
jgi:hypothetical protein